MRRSPILLTAAVGLALVAWACSGDDAATTSTTPDASTDVTPDTFVPPEGDGGASDADADAKPTSGDRYVYVLGGVLDAAKTTSATSAYRAPILFGGDLGSWQPVPALDLTRDSMGVAQTKSGALVLAGGRSPDAGALSGFPPNALVPAAFPVDRFGLAAAAIGDVVVASGGQSAVDTDESSTFVAAADPDAGTLSSWTATASLPEPLFAHAHGVLGARIYLVGGDRTGVGPTEGVASSSIAASGGLDAWTDAGSLPAAVAGHVVGGSGLRLYVIGGYDDTGTAVADVHAGTQAEDGHLEWTDATPLPEPIANACAITDGSTIYVIGGTASNGTPATSVYVARVASNGTLTWSVTTPMPSPRAFGACAAR